MSMFCCTYAQGEGDEDSLVAPPGRVVDLLLQRSLGMGVCLGGATELHAAADVVTALSAVLAVLAGEADLEGDAVTSNEVGDGRTDCDDGATGLVAQGQGLADDDVAVAEVVEVVQVGATEAGGLDGDLDLIAGGRGKLSLLL